MNANFVFIIVYLYLIGLNVGAAKSMGLKKGPFRSQVMTSRKCVKPKPAYLTELAPKVHVEFYNISTQFNLVKVNVTTLQVHKHLMVKIKFYNWDNGKWKFNNMINSDDCLGVVGIFFKLVALKYDKEQCLLPIGKYYLQDIDANSLYHALTNSELYGRALTRIEVFVKTAMLFCYDFESIVRPA